MSHIFWAKFESSGHGERCEDGKKKTFNQVTSHCYFTRLKSKRICLFIFAFQAFQETLNKNIF